MNKLMIAATAALCAAAGYGDGIESSNIVGYGPTATQEAGLTVGGSFVPVDGSGKVDLTELEVKGYMEEEGYCDALVNIQTLNEYGQTVGSYYWMDSGDGPTGEFYGWYPEGEDAPISKGTVEFQAGEGLWSYSNRDGLSIQSAGEVPTTTDVIVTLQEAGLSVANPTPIVVDLTDTYITGYMEEEGYSDALVNVQTLNEYGQTLGSFYWMDDGQGEAAEFFGWYPEGEDQPITKGTVTVAPGEGLWTYSNRDGLYFNWPKVDL